MLTGLEKGVPLYVILDAPDSVFSTLWERTAKKYWMRSANVHTVIGGLPKNEFEINHSTVTSSLANPWDHKQPAITESILSILCYKETSSMSPEERAWVEREVQKHLVSDQIVCDSDCYEIIRV
jgi:hypothetical protein